ncbi:MAG: serine/threonine protein kinase [Deltaproteobacteria bacterium]|nr:serine/threonine protein kinase [Deltaproteobacteria bacterium]MBW1904171.1 serine/threonine protein kinase [Deltaproteobacteria bacterium]MBW2160809.1 serine/threonine protein kinase [Deltaproteobacteria bacterium]MBW2586832.1 serine/threonine protein kinase [Deltaproteobacteria bacterium]
MRKICLRCGAKFGSRAEYCPHDGGLLVTDDEIADPLMGTVLLEQFRIEEQIGTGGMGTVYRAHQTTVGRDVAIKVLRPELARDEQAVFRFEREARVAISLDHPNLVRVFLSGRLPDGRLYIVMELLEGRSLADELDEQGLPSLERALIMTMKLCAGLGAVHAAGIVHRDIKPENVYLVRRGRDTDFVKLVDFGIARVLEAEGIGPTTTQNGRVFGTATYISPEAATGEETDQRSDIYSLGVLTYQLLTGELPFDGKTAGAVLMQHVHQAPPLLQATGRGAEVPDDVARVVMRSLSKDPAARQQTLAEFLDSLAEAAGNAGLLNDARALLFGTIWGDDLAAPGSYLAEILGSSGPPSSPSPLADTQPIAVERNPDDEALLSSAPKPFGTTSHNHVAASGPKQRNHKWLWASLGLLALVLVGVVTGTLWMQRAQPAVAEEPKAEPMEAPPVIAEEDAQVADVGTDSPVVEPLVIEEVVAEEPVVEEPPPKPKPKAKPKKKRQKKKVSAAGSVTESAAESAAEPAAESAAEPATESETAPEVDDGIDWTVPDFPSEPSPPTGTPDAPPRNPVVIDEPPAQ